MLVGNSTGGSVFNRRDLTMDTTKRPTTLPITLALEGGGALGAFTWGVLDRLVDETTLRVAAVSGTSAGAMNAAMLVQGLVQGGPDAAKRLLETFWHRVSIAAGSLPGAAGTWLQNMSAGMTAGMGPMLEAMRSGMTFANPLRGILAELLRPALFADPAAAELVIAATRVRTGEARLFWNAEVDVDALLASACLPMLFSAIEIDGETYWDGGYSSNPPVRPLIEAGAPEDVLIVRTMPAERLRPPSGASAVKDRLSEITFGGPLRAELHSLALAQSSLSGMSGLPAPLNRLRDARLHMIGPLPADADLMSAAMNPSWSFLTAQRQRGIAAAERFLAEHRADLGARSTLDLSPYAESVGATASSHPIRHFLEGAANAS